MTDPVDLVANVLWESDTESWLDRADCQRMAERVVAALALEPGVSS